MGNIYNSCRLAIKDEVSWHVVNGINQYGVWYY